MSLHKSTVDIKSGTLFPFQFLVLGAIIFVAGLAVVGPYMIIGLVLIIAGAIILTAHEGTEISPGSRTYREYNSILFIKSGKDKKYERIEKIFINPVRISQRLYTAHTMSPATFLHVGYNAYLKFSDGEKIFLFSGKNKSRLKKRLAGIAKILNIPVQDNTGDQ